MQWRPIHTSVLLLGDLNRISKATRAKPNIFYFCEPRQCENNGNPFKVNVNAFSRTFECEWFPQIFLKIKFQFKIWRTFIFCKIVHFQGFFPSTSCIVVFTIATISSSTFQASADIFFCGCSE